MLLCEQSLTPCHSCGDLPLLTNTSIMTYISRHCYTAVLVHIIFKVTNIIFPLTKLPVKVGPTFSKGTEPSFSSLGRVTVETGAGSGRRPRQPVTQHFGMRNWK